MRRTLNIEQHSVELDSSMGWLFTYRSTFGHDILPDLMPVVEAALAGLSEVFEAGVMQKDDLKAEAALELMNADAFVDMFIKLAGMELTTVLNIFWAMARNADPTLPRPEVYFNGFDRFPMDEIVPALFYMIVDSSVSSKNAESLLAKLRDLIPSISMSLSSPESTEG